MKFVKLFANLLIVILTFITFLKKCTSVLRPILTIIEYLSHAS
jgi:hypothetical protein